jgi:hypothetical protein
MVDLAFGIFGAAMFAEPAVTKVEEVVGLIHRGGCQVSGVRHRMLASPAAFYPAPDTWHLTPFYCRRRVSGVSVRRTGTEVRRPSRKICTWT